MKTIHELIKEAEDKYTKDREVFIQLRTAQETSINDYLIRVKQLPQMYLEKFPEITEDCSYRTFFPSLFETPLDKQKYTEEFEAFSKLTQRLHVLEETVNAQTRKVIEDYLNA
jgi:hypothetical protein